LTTRRKTFEKPVDRGYIRLHDGNAGSVRYALVVRTVDDEVDTGEFAGQFEVRGTLEVPKDNTYLDPLRKQVTLNMSDSRCVEAQVTAGYRAIRM
jgi:hypothetical protein